MMTVRSPSGFSVQFDDATLASRGEHHTDLYDTRGGTRFAQVPNDWLIEFVPASRAYDARTSDAVVQAEEIARLNRKLDRALRGARRKP